MNDKELVVRFIMEGYQNKNYDFILKCLSENYIDHSPAGAKGNLEAVNILVAVSKMFGDMRVSIEDVFSENGMVATRIRYKGDLIWDYKRRRLLVIDSRRFYIFCETFNIDGFKWIHGYLSKVVLRQSFDGMINMYRLVGGVLCAILALISILNFINSMMTSILSQHKEVTMLQSVGMTGQ